MKVQVGNKTIDLPDDYNPEKSNEEYMCDYDLAYFKKELEARLDDVSKKLTAENIDDYSVDRRSTDESDNISMETDTLTELRTKDRLRKLAKKIEEFLNKIDRNIYGYCEECGDEIGRKRLCYNPLARFCITDQAKIEENEDKKEQTEWSQEGVSSNYREEEYVDDDE